jgi:flavodoxin
MRKAKRPADELAEMIRDGLAEEGFEVLVHSNPRTGWDVAISSDKDIEGAQARAEAIAVELRQSCDLDA